MRLHRLELEGFGPFRDRQVVDFDAFSADGIFLIAGRTGAGKSSVLDGVCFALYGGVPRYEGAPKRLRSDHCAPEDPTRVTVEFSAAGSRWRVTRAPEYERPKQRGSGMTLEPHRAQLDELTGDGWVGRAARPVDVAHALEEILGLSQQQFLQVILLAQGRFAQFLLAGNDDRQRLLRKLFGTRTYEDYQSALEQRRKDAEQALSAAGGGVQMLLDEAERIILAAGLAGEAPDPVAAESARASEIDMRLHSAQRAQQRAAYRLDTRLRERDEADAAHRAAEAAHTAATALREKQQQRQRSRSALADLEAQAVRIAADRERLERANTAEALRAPIETAERAAALADIAAQAVATALSAWVAKGESADPAVLPARLQELTGDLAVATAGAEHERRLADGAAELAATSTRIDEFEKLLDALAQARAELPPRLRELDAQLAPQLKAAAALDSAEAGLRDADARLAAGREAERLHAELGAAESAHAEALDRLEGAAAAVTALLRRRLAGHAAELAAALVDGEACAVCGSTAHPRPATSEHEPVTDDDLAAAESAKDAAVQAERVASVAAGAARAAAAAATARAGGADLIALTAARRAAADALGAASDAARACERITAEREQLAQTDRDAAAEQEALAVELAGVRETAAALAADVDAARRAVDAARGAFPTVAERIVDATDRRRCAQALADANADAAARSSAAQEAAADRDARVTASPFATAAAATEALCDGAVRTELDERIREHDAALRAERDRLRELELDLAGAPEEPVDLTLSADALTQARQEWSAAVDAAADAGQTLTRLQDLLARAVSGAEAVAGLAEEHAVLARLAHTVGGRAPNTHRMTLESFVLAAELEEIVEAANLRLHDMSSGRYRLQHTDARAARGAASGLGLAIMDAHTGQARPAHSLSGGETFLASLALALGLAEVVTARAGGVALDTLFIDEGFGSLDDDTLELAMRTLDELRQGGRTVGLISHVAAMKEQLPAQLLIQATPQGPSLIHQERVVTAV